MAHTSILSVVAVLDGRQRHVVQSLRELHAQANATGAPFELVVVLNGFDADTQRLLRAEANSLDNLQIYALKARVDDATARMAGIENAIGDWVATLDVELDDPAVLGALYEAAIRDGAEVALGVPTPESVRRSTSDALLARIFHRAFRSLHGYSLSEEAPSARLLSRAVVNNVLQHDYPLVAIETLTATGGYRKTTVALSRRPGAALATTERIRQRWRTLIGINAVPLRLANLLCGTGALLALAYSIYVIVIYLVKESVVPGWTTVSLMLSAMFMMLSLVLWLLSEYLILQLDAGSRRARYEIAEEFASNVQARRQRLNVETEL